MSMESLIDLNDCTVEEWDNLVHLALDIREHPRTYMHCCDGKVMATLFYEPSTRTQMSFQAAMLRLGGQIIGFDNPMNSSVSKGETLRDTMRIISGYSDVIAMRHPEEGAPKAASLYAGCPVINAGDGGHLHPTQTLTDLVTLTAVKGRLDGLTVGLCGDLKYGRTVHSLLKAMSRFPGNRFYLIATPELAVPDYVRHILKVAGTPYREVRTLDECIGELDVLYMTRIQQERFVSKADYEKQKGVYVLDREKLSHARPDMSILHPLPRVDEITADIDDDPRALYFRQAGYGMYARMALILRILEGKFRIEAGPATREEAMPCSNPRCITHFEKYLPHLYKTEADGSLACAYCDAHAGVGAR